MTCKTEYDLDTWPQLDDDGDACQPVCADCMERPTFEPSMCRECALRLESAADYFYEP